MLTKRVSPTLQINLSSSNNQYEVTFTHIESTPDTQPSSSWFSFLKSEQEHVKVDTHGDTRIQSGYVQLLGYVVRNYNIEVTSGGIQFDNVANEGSVWENQEYATQYRDYEQEEMDDVQSAIDSIELFQQKRLTVNGKLGGAIIDGEPAQDLVYVFNAKEKCSSASSKEITDNIVPFYATPQSLLFSEMQLENGESKKCDFSFKVPSDLPPTYNASSTGPMCDMGYVSIRYTLVVGFLEEMKPKCVYFPVIVENKERRYSIIPKIDQSWRVNPEGYGKEEFCRDLAVLRESGHQALSTAPDDEDMEVPKGQNFFQIKYNDQHICSVRLHKATYSIGEDILYSVESHAGRNEIVGFTVHLEACEEFKGTQPLTNVYKCSSAEKFNTFASALYEGRRETVHGHMHVASYLTKGFEIEDFMRHSYNLAFKFNVVEMDLKKEGGFEEAKKYRFDTVGHEVKFRLPLVIL